MKLIPLTQNQSAKVDDDAPDWIFAVKWYAWRYPGGSWYAVRTLSNGKREYMHRAIMRPGAKEDVHHKDNNGLNNTWGNMQVLNKTLHRATSRKYKNRATSQFRGVVLVNNFPGRPWRAQISVAGVHKTLGFFKLEEEAARVYDTAAFKLFGGLATLNFPNYDDTSKIS